MADPTPSELQRGPEAVSSSSPETPADPAGPAHEDNAINKPEKQAGEGQGAEGHACVFARFSDFPGEIRDLIWELSMPDDEPELHLLRPVSVRPLAFPTVDIAWPAAMHVCAEARRACTRRLRFRPLAPQPPASALAAGLMASSASFARQQSQPPPPAAVPCRAFRADLDALHVDAVQWAGVFEAASRPAFYHGGLLLRLRHLAVDVVTARAAPRVARHALRHLRALELLTVHLARPGAAHSAGEVMPQRSGAGDDDHDAARAARLDGGREWDPLPGRRIKLRALTDGEVASTTIVERRHVLKVGELLGEFRAELERCTRENIEIWRAEGLEEAEEIGVWDYRVDRLRLRVDVRSLVEYRMGDAGPEWRPRTYKRVSRMINMLR